MKQLEETVERLAVIAHLATTMVEVLRRWTALESLALAGKEIWGGGECIPQVTSDWV